MGWMPFFITVVIIIFGLYLLSVGLLGLVRKRPFVFSARTLMWILLLVYLPILISSFATLFNRREHIDLFLITMPFINLALMVVLVFVYWRQKTSYVVFGIYDETFRDALTSTLGKLSIPFQETISKIRLIEIDADLQATVIAWMGTAQIGIKQRHHAHYTKQIATGMNLYYETTLVKVNNIAFIIYLILGILLLSMATVFIFSFGF